MPVPNSHDISVFFFIHWLVLITYHCAKKDWNKVRQRKEDRKGKKEGHEEKGKRRGHCMSPNLKQQPINHRARRCSKAMHGLFLSAKLSGCQFLPPKLLPLTPSLALSPYLVMSHCIFQYILLQTCGGEVALAVGGCAGVYRCERSLPPGLDKWAFRADVEWMGMKINLI